MVSWAVGLTSKKGYPKGQSGDPLLFNVFINDIFYFVKKGTLYNYADDNTLSYGHPDFNVLIFQPGGRLVRQFIFNLQLL
jgi:hypothetical protein